MQFSMNSGIQCDPFCNSPDGYTSPSTNATVLLKSTYCIGKYLLYRQTTKKYNIL